MATDKRTGWLADLKPGDEVIVPAGYNGCAVAKVDRITPSGVIIVGRGRYNPSGRLQGASTYAFNCWLCEATLENREKAESTKLQGKIARLIYDLDRLRGGHPIEGYARVHEASVEALTKVKKALTAALTALTEES